MENVCSKKLSVKHVHMEIFWFKPSGEPYAWEIFRSTDFRLGNIEIDNRLMCKVLRLLSFSHINTLPKLYQIRLELKEDEVYIEI